MAIDYKKEWEELHTAYENNIVVGADAHKTVSLGELMERQIKRTINKREKLMKEYVKESITTEIDGGERHFHNVNIIDKRHETTKWLIGTIHVHKADFNAWCKKRGGK